MTSLGKGLQILKYMTEPPYEYGVSEIAEKVGIVKSGAHKLLVDLLNNGFVIQNKRTRQYRLGPAVYRLGTVYSEMRGIIEASDNVIKGISSVTGTSVLLGLRDADEAFLAYKIDPPGAFSYRGQVGRAFPLHAGALGKLLGAYMETRDAQRILDSAGLRKITSITVTDRETLFQQYSQIRRQGYCLALGENIDGAFGLAVPIFDRNMEVWSCLCAAGPRELYKPELKEDWLRLLREGAKEISYKLGVR